jgi:hypothetical protein
MKIEKIPKRSEKKVKRKTFKVDFQLLSVTYNALEPQPKHKQGLDIKCCFSFLRLLSSKYCLSLARLACLLHHH